jgi:hypothetical protein
MEHDAWFFVGVFVFIFLVWIAVGGPTHPISFTGPGLALPDVLGGGTYLNLPRASFGLGTGNVSLPGSSSGSGSSGNTETPTFTGGTAFGIPSPYRGLVSLNHYVSGANSSNPTSEYVEINASQNAGAPVNISGWRIYSEATGNSATIPKGTEVPISGTVNAAQDIVLTPGMRALLISGQSPLGASFRENKCIGYFSNFQSFYPSLSQTCPVPSDELSSFYGPNYIRDAVCIEYVKTIPRCKVALSPPVGVSGMCQSFLVKYLNYNGCVTAHQGDANFEGNTWRIYLGRSNSMWQTKNELVKLIDANGKTVDAFSY